MGLEERILRAATKDDFEEANRLVKSGLQAPSSGAGFPPGAREYLLSLPDRERDFYVRFTERRMKPTVIARETGVDVEVIQAILTRIYANLREITKQRQPVAPRTPASVRAP